MARPGILYRQYLVQKGFQRKFILLYMAVVTVVAATISAVLYRTVDQAVESHLYRTHIRVERVGDFLFDLLFSVNFYAILAIVLLVMLASMIVFRKINRNYQGLERRLLTMSDCEDVSDLPEQTSFFEIGRLNQLLEQLRSTNAARLSQLEEALNVIDEALEKKDDQRLLAGKRLVDEVLDQVELQ